jgi:uncharacterized protein (DUF2141 family)
MTLKFKIKSLFFLFIIILAYSCANKAQGPTGGLKDKNPPRLIKSLPANGAVNFNGKRIQIEFDELITVEKISENVIISPPQVKPPEIKSFGRRVTVEFEDKLKDSTTYSINFGNAIADVNEKNILKNFLFAYSTGNEIDTLQISGTVINSEDLNPISGIYVGVYEETNDSAFFKKPFLRIGKTDNMGRFSINNLKKGSYKVYALGDMNHDFIYQSGEGLALYDSLVAPSFKRVEMQDTLWKDSTHIDTIKKHIGTQFEPNNLALGYFKEAKKRQYLVKSERKELFNFSLYFNTPLTTLPTIEPLNFEWNGKYLLQKNNSNDSITYWITDSLVYKTDTLKMKVSYLKSDSLFKLVSTTDTLNLFSRKAIANAKLKSNKKTQAKITKQTLKFSNNLSSTFDIYNPIIVKFEAPLATIDISKIHLKQKVDSAFKPITFKWREMDSTKMNYAIEHKWEAETTYALKIDSGAFSSIYKRTSGKDSGQFKIKSLDDYSSIKMVLAKFSDKAVIQVLDTKDQLLVSKPAKEKGTVFEYLKPGDYYIRMFIDRNGNGKWDTGELISHRHPEEVFYYPKKVSVKANWEFEESWDYLNTPLLKQKPLSIQKDAAKKEQNQ